MSSHTEEILTNVCIFIPYALLGFSLFLHLEHRIPRFYHPNMLWRGDVSRPLMRIFGSFWQKIPSRTLLAMAGLDAFIYTQVQKMMLVACLAAAVPLLFVLLPWYIHYGWSMPVEKWSYDNFTIAMAYDRAFWLPLVVTYVVSFVILYTIYAFYRRTMALRRIYLEKPSAAIGIQDLLQTVEGTGRLQLGRKYFDEAARTLLISNIPKNWSSQHISQALDDHAITGLRSISLIHTDEEVAAALKARDKVIDLLEQSILEMYNRLKATGKPEIVKFTVEKRSKLMLRLLKDPAFLEGLRPNHIVQQSFRSAAPSLTEENRDSWLGLGPEDENDEKIIKKEVDSLSYYYKAFVDAEKAFAVALKEYQAAIHVGNAEEDLKDLGAEPEMNFPEETSLISLKQIFSFNTNLSPAAKALSSASRAALLHFSTVDDAHKARQLLRDATIAPIPSNLVWREGTKFRQRPYVKFFRNSLSTVAFILYIIIIAPISVIILHAMDLASMAALNPDVAAFRESHPVLCLFFQGVLAPYLMQQILKLFSQLMMWTVSLAGSISMEERQERYMARKTFFYLFNSVFLGIVIGSMNQVFEAKYIYGAHGILKNFQTNSIDRSHSFLNLLIQTICVELNMELILPLELMGHLIGKSKKITPRESLQLGRPSELDPYESSVRLLFFPFLLTMSFVFISPLFIIPAIGYFYFSYHVFRYKFLHFGRNPVETGGKIWPCLARQLIYALAMGQVAFAAQALSFKAGLPVFLLELLLIALTLSTIPFFEHTFVPQYNQLTIARDESKESLALIEQISQEQDAIIFSESTKEVMEVFVECERNDSDGAPGPLSDSISIDVESLAQIHSNSIFETVPVPVEEAVERTSSRDPLKLSHTLDIQYAQEPYSHPAFLKHEAVLYIPAGLPSLLMANSMQ